MSLRRRLIVTFVVLAVVGFISAYVLIFFTVKSDLLDSVNGDLTVAENQVYGYLVATYLHRHPPSYQIVDTKVSPNIYVLVQGVNGSTVLARPSGSDVNPDPAPILPQSYPVAPLPPKHILALKGRVISNPGEFDVASVQAKFTYRALATRVPQGTLFVMESLEVVNSTLSSLLRTEIISGVVTLLILTAIVFLLVRRDLKLLELMIKTADTISQGDFSARVNKSDKTEIGRLSSAFDDMLNRVESAFKQKEVSEKKLREFIQDASHELRTPLTTIRGYSELLKNFSEDLSEDSRTAIARIESESVRLSRLVQDLLLLAKQETDTGLVKKRVDLNGLLATVIDDFRINNPSYPIQLQESGTFALDADADRLVQALRNLLENIVNHCQPETQIIVRLFSGNADAVAIEVEDNGCGVSEEERELIFERHFTRHRKAFSESESSTGLGLAISKTIIEAHGGQIRFINPIILKGACVHISLPL